MRDYLPFADNTPIKRQPLWQFHFMRSGGHSLRGGTPKWQKGMPAQWNQYVVTLQGRPAVAGTGSESAWRVVDSA